MQQFSDCGSVTFSCGTGHTCLDVVGLWEATLDTSTLRDSTAILRDHFKKCCLVMKSMRLSWHYFLYYKMAIVTTSPALRTEGVWENN